ncbi:MAG: phosphotransferase [Alphaproteobacteria bacterium]|nr:phosphotransferase [Alphaproteobacteria bacterium]
MDFESKFDHRESGWRPDDAALQAVLADAGIAPQAVEWLPGGFSNANAKVTAADGGVFLLRLSGMSARAFGAETAALKRLRGIVPVQAVHFVRANHPALSRHVALLEYLPGVALCTVEDGMTPQEISSIGAQLGGMLARIHAVGFAQSGFFGEDFAMTAPFADFHAGWFGHMRACLENALLAERLTAREMEDLKAYAEASEPIIQSMAGQARLVHSDFNQKNILVEKRGGGWAVTGILDWEFCFSGAPLVDIGNFFRYAKEMSPHYAAAFVEAYAENGGRLPENWRDAARALDLLSMLSFLTQKEDRPKTRTTALAVLRETLYGD